MKYSLLAIALIAFTFTAALTGCGDPKPGSKPPSLYENEKGERLGAPAGGKE